MSMTPNIDSYERPIRQNSFFAHLNHDVRCVIYDLLDLPPISLSCLGLVLSCRQALAESERIAVVQLNRFLGNLQETAQREGRRLKLPNFKLNASYPTLIRLEVEIQWRATEYRNSHWDILYELLGGSFSKVRIIFMSTEEVEQDGIGAAAEEAASDTDTTSILSRSWLRPEHADLHDDALRCMDIMAFSFRMAPSPTFIQRLWRPPGARCHPRCPRPSPSSDSQGYQAARSRCGTYTVSIRPVGQPQKI